MRRVISLSALAGAAALVVPTGASAKTVVVYAGGSASFQHQLAQKYPTAGINNFLINKVVINVGDTVTWNGASLAGGFHTVDIPARHGSDLPLLLPSGGMVTGVNDFSGTPFWFNGKVPNIGFNPALGAPSGGNTYNGSSRVDSGLPGPGGPKDFSVTFTKPGTFNYFCDVHYGMGGQIVVKNKHARVPTAKQNATALAHEERNYLKEAKQVSKTKVKKGQVSVGESGPGGLELFGMFPSTLTIKAGTTVQFVMSRHTREVHTASFGPKSYLDQLSATIQSPSPSAAAIYPSDPPGTIALAPSTHGNGFASTGVLDRDKGTPTIPAVGAIKFTTPGTYNYECLIHSFMKGTIVVTK